MHTTNTDHTAESTANIVPLTAIAKRRSKNLDFTIKVNSPIELTDGEVDVCFELTVNCEMDGDDIRRLTEFKNHTIQSCAASIGRTDVKLTDEEAFDIFAEFYSVARKNGTFPNRERLVELCRAKNDE